MEKQLLVILDRIVEEEITDFKNAGLSIRWSSQVPQRGESHVTVVEVCEVQHGHSPAHKSIQGGGWQKKETLRHNNNYRKIFWRSF